MFKNKNKNNRGLSSSSPRRVKARSAEEVFKSRSFHYSARRVRSEQATGRKEEIFDEEAEAAKKPSNPLLVKAMNVTRKMTLLVILAAMIFAFYLNGDVRLEDVKRYDGDAGAVEKFATNELKKSGFFTRNKLLLDEEKLEKSVKNEFLGIISVDASTKINSHTVVLSIEMSRPTLLLSNGTNVYVVGEDGVILIDTKSKKTNFDTSKLPLVQDQSGIPLEIGKQALTVDQVKYVTDVSYQSERVGLMVDTMIMLPGGVQMDVRYGGLNYYVKYNLFEDARQSTGTFLAMKEELDKKKQKPQEYIDVRIAERAYVK